MANLFLSFIKIALVYNNRSRLIFVVLMVVPFFLSACSKNKALEIDSYSKQHDPKEVLMIINHQEKFQNSLDRCYYTRKGNHSGEFLGVMIYASTCPKNIIYNFILNIWKEP